MPWPSKTAVAIVGAIAYSLLLLHWGDRYGPNSQANAAMAALQAEKNGALEQQVKDDAEIFAAETADAAKRLEAFKSALQGLKSCPLDQSDVDAINSLIGG